MDWLNGNGIWALIAIAGAWFFMPRLSGSIGCGDVEHTEPERRRAQN